MWSWRRWWREGSQGTAMLRLAGWACGQGKLQLLMSAGRVADPAIDFCTEGCPHKTADLELEAAVGRGKSNPAQLRFADLNWLSEKLTFHPHRSRCRALSSTIRYAHRVTSECMV